MLRAGLADREQFPVPYHSVYNNQDDDDETFGLNGGGEKRLHRRNPSWLERDYRLRRSVLTRIVTKPCRSIKTFLFLFITVSLVGWYLKPKVIPSATTFIFHEVDTRRVWEWEIQSGHWMSWRPIKIWFYPPRNPSLPSPSDADDVEHPGGVIGCGWKRRYVHIDDLIYTNTTTKLSKSPPRPVPGSIVDFDIVTQYCDHTTGQYLRTCLAFLRLGAHLDTFSPHLRIPAPKDTLGDAPVPPHFFIGTKVSKIPKKPLSLPLDWRYCYLEDRMSIRAPMSEWSRYGGGRGIEPLLEFQSPRAPNGGVPAYSTDAGTVMVPQAEQEPGEGEKEKKKDPWDVDKESMWVPGQCEEEYPRIVHMSWEGGFGDAPYMTLLSFLYSQNLGLDRAGKDKGKDLVPCHPQFWVWIREADETWEKRLASNSWSAVFLEEKFNDIIKFKRWNTTEQMDATPELAGAWRNAVTLDLGLRQAKDRSSVLVGNDLHERGFTGPDAAGRLHSTLNISVADTARWVLPHRYGGVYVEPGLLFLRDWEELWNYRGSFSTRSFGGHGGASLLRLNKNSALGTVVLRTALRHGMRLGPDTVQTYVEDAGVDQLLFPIPDMLQNLAFWSGETYQRRRPTVPSFDGPQEFFEPSESSLPATEIGVSGFFRGAWFYHARPERYIFISSRIPTQGSPSASDMPFDRARNYASSSSRSPSGVFGPGEQWDVPWSAVFKRTLEAFIRGEQPNMYGEWLVGYQHRS